MMSRNNKLSLTIIVSLFFLWGLAHNMNPILIPHLKKACQLSDLESALIDSAFYIGYFIMALPAGLAMKRIGYKGGILVGLILFSLGAFLFYPAASFRAYNLFLGALFITASGLTFLETAANPYVTMLGSPKSAVQRLNFAQSFNGLAATLAPYIGALFILSGQQLSPAELESMGGQQLNLYLNAEAATLKIPYLVIGLVVLAVAVAVSLIKLPNITEGSTASSGRRFSLWKEKNLLLAVVAQFFYVGAQVCISSFFIRFAGFVADVPEKSAAMLLSISLLAFMLGRFFGTFLMKYILPSKLLVIYSLFNIGLIFFAVITSGFVAVYCLMGVQFFMSIMFPTIFSLGIRGLGAGTKQGSSYIIMSIVGGAIFPLLMGRVSDVFNVHYSYLVPCLCFVVVVLFAMKQPKEVAATSVRLVR